MRIATQSDPGYVDLRTFYAPGIPSVIVSPRSVLEKIGFDNCNGYLLETRFDTQTFLFHAKNSRNRKNDVIISGSIDGTLNYTRPIILPSFDLPGETVNIPMNQIVQDFSVMTLSGTGLKLLWHQRLGHCSDEKLANAHKFADGVPKFTSTHNIMDNCPVCLAAKMKYRARGTDSTRRATRPFQGLSIDRREEQRAILNVTTNVRSSYVLNYVHTYYILTERMANNVHDGNLLNCHLTYVRILSLSVLLTTSE